MKYMSISFDSEEIPQEPIPLVYRVFEGETLKSAFQLNKLKLYVSNKEFETVDYWKNVSLGIFSCFKLNLLHFSSNSTFHVSAPIHEVSVCVGPIYGSESKWLEVAEFIEHYKLIGVRYFYFTVFNMNEYSRKIIDEYLR